MFRFLIMAQKSITRSAAAYGKGIEKPPKSEGFFFKENYIIRELNVTEM